MKIPLGIFLLIAFLFILGIGYIISGIRIKEKKKLYIPKLKHGYWEEVTLVSGEEALSTGKQYIRSGFFYLALSLFLFFIFQYAS